MKRYLKIMISLFALAFIWIFGISTEYITYLPYPKLAIPIIILGLLGVASLTQILYKVKQLEEHP